MGGNGAVVAGGYAGGYGEAQAAAVGMAFADAGDAVEGNEEVGEGFGWDAGA